MMPKSRYTIKDQKLDGEYLKKVECLSFYTYNCSYFCSSKYSKQNELIVHFTNSQFIINKIMHII